MTITTTYTVERYVGDGIRNTWPISFPFFSNTDIKACIVGSTGEQINLIYGTEYTVTKSKSSIGGTLQYVLGDGVELIIWLSLPLTQGADFYNTGPLNTEIFENALDRLTLITQQLQEMSDRSMKVSPASKETPEQLMASLYAGRDIAVISASAATSSESNTAVSEQAAATSASEAAGSASTAEAWAESEAAPDPNDAESKSAKSWALIASDNVPTATATLAGKAKASASWQVDPETGEATVPNATTTLAGIVRQATNGEASGGENDSTFMTPLDVKTAIDACRASNDELTDSSSATKLPNVAQTLRTDLSNVSDIGKAATVGWGMPDYSAGVAKTVNVLHTAEVNGWIKLGGDISQKYLNVNDEMVASILGSGTFFLTYPPVPVGIGDTYKFTGVGGSITFYPTLGEV